MIGRVGALKNELKQSLQFGFCFVFSVNVSGISFVSGLRKFFEILRSILLKRLITGP